MNNYICIYIYMYMCIYIYVCIYISEKKRKNNKENMYEENIFLPNLHYSKFRE